MLSAGLVRAVTRGAQHDWSLLKRLRPRSSARLVSVDKRGSARRPPSQGVSHLRGLSQSPVLPQLALQVTCPLSQTRSTH